MFTPKPRYSTQDVSEYVRCIETTHKLRDSLYTAVRINQNATSQQKLAWHTEIENYSRDIATMQASLAHILKRVRKEQQG